MMPGGASREGTERYFERLKRSFPNYHDTSWFLTPALLPFRVSRIGIGTYRAHRDRTEHHEALREAFISGINIVDTAANHSDGAAEVLVGNVIRELIESKRLFRDEVVVVERAGFIEDSALQLLRGRMPADTVALSPTLAHCIHPDFLSMQIEWSLQRLGLQTIDLFLLQNPEIQRDSEKDGSFFDRIQKSLARLEEERSRGRIQFYGISSNLLPSAEGIAMLERILKIAPPGFRAIQLPANLLETGYRPVAALARKKGIFTMGCRPLNSLHDGRVVRLARLIDPPPHGEENPEARQMRIEDELLSLEERMLRIINEKEHRLTFDARVPSVYRTLLHYRQKINDLETILPMIDALAVPFQRTVSSLKAGLERSSDAETGRLLFERYMRLVHTALGFLLPYATYKNHLALERLERSLQEATHTELPLAGLAVQAALADGLDTVFVGMRRARAVRQMCDLFSLTAFQKIPEIQESLLPEAFGE